jgi:hypothetical protein
MANRLAVFSSVERLWPHDDATHAVFGVNVATAMIGGFDPDADADWLEPWKWATWEPPPNQPGFAVWVVGRAGRIQVLPHSRRSPGRSGQGVRACMRRRELYEATNAAAFVWNPDDRRPRRRRSATTARSRRRRGPSPGPSRTG